MVFHTRAIIEVLGMPEKHIVDVVDKVLEKLKNENGITLEKQEVSKPELVKEKYYAIFAEVEIKAINFTKLLQFCYDYMPTSIEILDMDKIAMPVREFTNGINDSLIRLHQYNITVANLNQKVKELEQNK